LLASGITALKAALAALHKPLLGVFITHAYLNWTSPREVDTGVMRPWSMVAG